jgi:hypothetical protein
MMNLRLSNSVVVLAHWFRVVFDCQKPHLAPEKVILNISLSQSTRHKFEL